MNQLITPGDHSLTLNGVIGPLEANILVPDKVNSSYIALLGHPHSLQGGTMHNKVVTILARTFKEMGISSVRFNFRGVGQSAGSYDAGIGESQDMLAIVQQLTPYLPGVKWCFAGFSFGSYVAYRAAAQANAHVLVTVAPPVHRYDYKAFSPKPLPWIVVQGDKDEVVPVDEVLAFATAEQLPVLQFPETGHFFHGQLLPLKARLLEALAEVLR
ncbi:MAG: hypothetical protein B7X00_00545 [Legionella sp. 21-45-4]|nr:MAG: hypothetical protein B7X00_00545 [Legionella sp. 21-45-4]